MPSANPPRKFAPTPIEQTTKSSRQTSPPKGNGASTRRFAPQLVETTSKSSQGEDQQQQDPNKKPRRFAPQVVEESRKSSSGRNGEEKGDGRPHIRFNIEPISTTSRSSRKSKDDEDEPVSPGTEQADSAPKAPRRFAPILLDTAKRSRRANSSDDSMNGSRSDRTESGFHLHAQEHRRHITGKATPAPGSDDGMDEDGNAVDKSAMASSSYISPSELRKQMGPADRRLSSASRQHSFRMPDLATIESSESEREASDPSSLSSSYERAGSPFTPSSSYEFYKHATRIRESVDETFTHYLLELERKKAQQRLEEQALAAYPNADWGYEPPHHYVNIEEDESDEVEDRPVTFEGNEDDNVMEQMAAAAAAEARARRESGADVSWEQRELQRHAEKMQSERKQATTRRESSQSPWWRPGVFAAFQDQQNQHDSEISSMRDRARPPMLGNDIVFARCPSPEPARFDVTQGPLRNQTDGAQTVEAPEEGEPSLWTAPEASADSSFVVTAPNSRDGTVTSAGLWGGFCVADEDEDRPGTAKSGGLMLPSAPTGLLTPMNEPAGNPFDAAFSNNSSQPASAFGSAKANNNGQDTVTDIAITPSLHLETPSTQPPNKPHQSNNQLTTPADLNRIDSILVSDAALDAHMEVEFPDSFITQVFNYLSLGYPALARPFDAELAKISRISLAELRKDDIRAKNSPRGYIRLGMDFEGNGGDGGGAVGAKSNGKEGAAAADVDKMEGVVGGEVKPLQEQQLSEEMCVRWQALKLYVREWARQEKGMVAGGETWELQGHAAPDARRGSWAL